MVIGNDGSTIYLFAPPLEKIMMVGSGYVIYLSLPETTINPYPCG